MLLGIAIKAWADLRRRPLQTAILFLALGAAAFLLTLSLNLRRGLDNPWGRVFEQSNGAHVWTFAFSALREDWPVGSLAALPGLPGVVGSSGLRAVSPPELRQEHGLGYIFVELPLERPEVAAPVVTSGQWFSSPGEVMLDVSLAHRLGVGTGGSIRVNTEQGPRDLRVAGLVQDPGAPFAAAYVSEGFLSSGYPGARLNYMLGVRLADASRAGAFIAAAGAAVPAGYPVEFYEWTWFEQRDAADVEIRAIFISVFSVFALLAVAFIIVITTSARVLTQYRDFGILKAVGFTPAQVAAVFLVSQAGLALAAGVAGAVAGAAFSPIMLDDAAVALRTVPPEPWSLPVVAGSAGLVALMAALATLAPAFRAGRLPAVHALRTTFGSAGGRPSRVARFASALGMPAVVVLGVKDVLGSRTRATFTVGILVLAAATLTFQLVADSSMARYSVTPALVGEEPYPVYAFREGDGAMSPEDTASLIRSVPGVAASYTRVSYDGVAGGIPAQIRAVDGDYAAFDWALTAGRLPATDAEAAVGTVFADAAGVKPGGRLTVTMGERSFDVTVTGVFRSQADNTPPITVRASALAAAGVPIAPPRLFGILPEAGVSTSDLAASLARAADGRLDVVDAAGEVRRDMDEFRPVLYSLSLTMAAIAIGGTLAALMLATEERRREFGVLRAVGMTPGQVALSVTSGALLMAAAGLVLGVPLGFLLTTQLVKVIGDAAGIGTAPWVVPSAVSLALLAPLMAAVAVFGALLPAARAGRLQVVAAIRSE